MTNSSLAIPTAQAYLGRMRSTFDFCLPTRAVSVPDGPDWLHEIKYDGYRLRLERDGDRVRLITRGGYNWTDRYPWIIEAARKNRIKQFGWCSMKSGTFVRITQAGCSHNPFGNGV